jgi:astacin
VIDGQLVAEGDMIVGPAEPEAESGHPKPGARREASGTTEAASRWPGGVIPIMFDRSMFLLFDPVRNTGVLDPRLVPALTHWWQNLPGIFVLRSNEPNYVIFRAVPDGCSSWVGRQERPQFIDLAPDCTVGSIIHEFGHAAGLYHEHVRQDRDDFVTVLWNNILIQANGHNERHNFEIPAANARDIGDYDYGSIMHYGRFAFSANGLPTLETIPPGIAIGQRNGLSAGDIAGVKKVQCSPSVSRRSIAAPVEGGEYEVTVTAPAYCSWTVREDVNWITAGADGGTGNGRVILAVLRNALPEPRQATVTIAGQSVSVTQERRVIQDPRPR